jgi:hypothetical protein
MLDSPNAALLQAGVHGQKPGVGKVACYKAHMLKRHLLILIGLDLGLAIATTIEATTRRPINDLTSR